MLKTLDRYIIKKFLRTFFFTVLIFTMIAVVIDFSEKVEDFIETDITTREIVLGWYPSFILFVEGLLWPLYTLIAVIFFTSRLAYNSEIISIFNAGVSFRRLLAPYLLAATLVASMLLVGNHWIIPNGNKTMLRIDYTYLSDNEDEGKSRDVHMFVSPDTKIYVKSYRKRDSSARDFRVERFEDDRLAFLLKARSAQWMGPPDNWRLQDYEIRRFDGRDEELILGHGQQMDTTLNLTPQDFVDYKNQQIRMTTPELQTYIQRQRERGVGNTKKYEVEYHRRTAEAFTIYILTIIGVSLAARKVRGGMGLHLALGVGLGAVFIFLSRFSIVFATGQSIPVLVGIWLPNVLFGLIALLLIVRAQK